MSPFLEEFLKQYGLPLIASAAVFAVVIWGFVHFSAAPGTTVKVLWGLAEYTKTSTAENEKTTVSDNTPQLMQSPKITKENDPAGISADQRGAVNLDIRHDVYGGEVNSILESIRAEFDLRELRPLESGFPVDKTPVGTLFFVSSIALGDIGSITIDEKFSEVRVSRYKTDEFYFEMHHDRDGAFYIITFISEFDANRIRFLDGTKEFELIIAPIATEHFTSLARIPFMRILSSRERSIQNDQNNTTYVLDLKLL